MRIRNKRQSGNAMVEFALVSAILLPCMTGTFQFGYTFYTYNLLESAVSNAARYGSFRTYRALTSGDIAKGKTAIKNVAVYGTPSPPSNAVPQVKGLATSNINVSYTLNAQNIPMKIKVDVTGFKINAVFKDYTLTGKPSLSLPYLGRYAPSEQEN